MGLPGRTQRGRRPQPNGTMFNAKMPHRVFEPSRLCLKTVGHFDHEGTKPAPGENIPAVNGNINRYKEKRRSKKTSPFSLFPPVQTLSGFAREAGRKIGAEKWRAERWARGQIVLPYIVLPILVRNHSALNHSANSVIQAETLQAE